MRGRENAEEDGGEGTTMYWTTASQTATNLDDIGTIKHPRPSGMLIYEQYEAPLNQSTITQSESHVSM